MKPLRLLVSAAAIFAGTACNADKGNATAANTADSGVTATPVAAPNNGDWSSIVGQTPEGGFMMGNPNAKVRLVEFGSMTCHVCADFEEQGGSALIENYVKKGLVAYEFRNFVRDPYDITAALIARCGGPSGFFVLTRGLYAEQKDWIGKLQTVSAEQQQALMGLPPAQQFGAIAKMAGFPQWAAMRGLPSAKSAACLADEAAVTRLVQMNSDATTQYPEFAGTPTFILNGTMLENTAAWEQLEPKLRAAVGA